jgi:hypothetical protein
MKGSNEKKSEKKSKKKYEKQDKYGEIIKAAK